MSENFQWPETDLPIAIVGPTATGKTDAALALAERIGGEILNADSMQVYVGMNIGTAKPTAAEQARIPFHLLDIANPDAQITVSLWKNYAEAAIADIVSRRRRVILCGGTGMYVRALLDNWSLAETPADPALRAALQAEWERDSGETLLERLRNVDLETAARLHPNEGRKIIRAMEVYHATGRPISEWQAEDRRLHPPRPAHVFGLDLPRSALYERIERRVDRMISAGLVAEVQDLIEKGYNETHSPMRSLGYKEISDSLDGVYDLNTAVAAIKQNTRRYAKRQQTWFRAERNILWLDVSELSSAQVTEQIQAKTARDSGA